MAARENRLPFDYRTPLDKWNEFSKIRTETHLPETSPRLFADPPLKCFSEKQSFLNPGKMADSTWCTGTFYLILSNHWAL